MKEWRLYDVRFILQLGDIIDGFCKQTEKPDVCLDRVLDIFEQETWPVLNVVGNHELYNFPKDKLYTSRLLTPIKPSGAFLSSLGFTRRNSLACLYSGVSMVVPRVEISYVFRAHIFIPG
jgi:hypothetical protein